MSYKRKTRDTWQLHINYGQGWEHETTEDSWQAAKAQSRCYAENCPQYPRRIVYRRERLEDATK